MAHSSNACSRGSSADRAQMPIMDEETELPLVVCDQCLDVRLIALTTKDPKSKFFGQRFFKCPTNKKGVRGSCGNYYLHAGYQAYLRSIGLLEGESAVSRGENNLVINVQDLLEANAGMQKELQEAKTRLHGLNGVQALCRLGKLIFVYV